MQPGEIQVADATPEAPLFRLGPDQVAAIVILGCTLVGLGLRLALVWHTNLRLPDSPARLIGDESQYDNLARNLLRGSFFQAPHRTPLYPIFLAESYLFLGQSYARVLYAQAFLGALVVPLTYLTARYFVTWRLAAFAAAIAACVPVLVFQVRIFYPEVLFTPLLLLVVVLLLRSRRAPRLSRFAAAGASLGLLSLCRPTAALLFLVVPVVLPTTWTLKHRAILTLVYIGAMAAVIAPWTYHNYRTYDTFLPLAVSSYANWQGSPEYYHLYQSGWDALQIYDAYVNPANNGGHDPLTIAGSAYFDARARDSILAEPHIYAWYSLQKVIFLWIGHPANRWEWPFDLASMRKYYATWEIAAVLASRALPLAAAIALIPLRHRLRGVAPLLLVCGYFMLVHAILVSEGRYSEPLYPLLAIIVAAAIGTLRDRRQGAAGGVSSTGALPARD